MTEDRQQQSRRTARQARPAVQTPAPPPVLDAADARADSGDRLALGLMLGIVALLALLTLALVVSIL